MEATGCSSNWPTDSGRTALTVRGATLNTTLGPSEIRPAHSSERVFSAHARARGRRDLRVHEFCREFTANRDVETTPRQLIERNAHSRFPPRARRLSSGQRQTLRVPRREGGGPALEVRPASRACGGRVHSDRRKSRRLRRSAGDSRSTGGNLEHSSSMSMERPAPLSPSGLDGPNVTAGHQPVTMAIATG